eukprot:Nitzschia sp. Nitz4//NODE_367_length_23738_cov_71.755985//7959//9137//NITZ4_additional_000043-RA//1//CDS//3329531852//8544//frame0
MTSQEIQDKLDKVVQAEAKKNIVHRGFLAVESLDTAATTVSYRTAFGQHADQISTNDPFFIASITKMMTASIIFQLIDEGKMKLDAPISTYLPPPPTDQPDMFQKLHVYRGTDSTDQLLVAHLLRHTSGLGDYFAAKPKKGSSLIQEITSGSQDPSFSLQDVLERSKLLGADFVPGAKNGHKANYSDTNYQLLGAMIEHVTGETLALNLQRRIFDPLGLSEQTYLYTPKAAATKSKAPHHFYNGKMELMIPNAMASFRGDGGLVSTLEDMLVFLKAYFQCSKGDAGTELKLFDAQHLPNDKDTIWNTVFFPLAYGTGVMQCQIPRWMTLYTMDPPALQGHSGASASFAYFVPSRDLLLVGTFNQMDQESRPFPFMYQIVDALDRMGAIQKKK